jgi:ribosome recycling factor
MSDGGDDLRALAFEECRDKMRKAVAHLQEEFGGIRTGRATPGLVEKLKVDAYGVEVPLQQIAGISVPEPRVLVISPYDKGSMKAIEKAIQVSVWDQPVQRRARCATGVPPHGGASSGP